jgi:short-subunit dehydrogenase
MGRSAVLQLAAKGANIIAVSRTASKLEALMPELKVGRLSVCESTGML